MITIKTRTTHYEHADYTLSLIVEECLDRQNGTKYPQFYVTLNREGRVFEEIAHYEPCDLDLALDYYNELEEYVIASGDLYDSMELSLTTISRNAK